MLRSPASTTSTTYQLNQFLTAVHAQKTEEDQKKEQKEEESNAYERNRIERLSYKKPKYMERGILYLTHTPSNTPAKPAETTAYWIDGYGNAQSNTLTADVLEKIAVEKEDSSIILNFDLPAENIPAELVKKIASVYGCESDLLEHIGCFGGKDGKITPESSRTVMLDIGLPEFAADRITVETTAGAVLANHHCPGFTTKEEVDALSHDDTKLYNPWGNYDKEVHKIMCTFAPGQPEENKLISKKQFNAFVATRGITSLKGKFASPGEWTQLFFLKGTPVQDYKLRLMTDLTDKPEPNTMYVEKRQDALRYKVIDPNGKLVKGSIPNDTLPLPLEEPLLDALLPLSPILFKITSDANHTDRHMPVAEIERFLTHTREVLEELKKQHRENQQAAAPSHPYLAKIKEGIISGATHFKEKVEEVIEQAELKLGEGLHHTFGK